MVKKLLNKKGQLKIQQMIFVLIAVTLLFVFVGIFFLSIKLNTLKKTASNLEEEEAKLLVSKLANSPEFSCGYSFGSGRTSCVDFDKVMALKSMKEDYSGFWGIAKIEIRKIFPDETGECDSSNYPNCGLVTILDKEINTGPATSNYVILCRKDSNDRVIYDKCELAVLLVSSEDKE